MMSLVRAQQGEPVESLDTQNALLRFFFVVFNIDLCDFVVQAHEIGLLPFLSGRFFIYRVKHRKNNILCVQDGKHNQTSD